MNIKKIGLKIFDFWLVLSVLGGIGAYIGGLKQFGWLGVIIFLGNIIVFAKWTGRNH
jgi:hypothetical protein